MFGTWNVNVSTSGMPQTVASAIAGLGETLLGCTYTPIAYLGSQMVNGVNHAVLAEQAITTGQDTKNIVVLVFNEKPGDMKATLVSIDRVVASGAPLGGIHLAPTTEIPEDKMDEWKEAFNGFVGSYIEPFAYLGSQMVKGSNEIFAAVLTPVAPKATSKVVIVTLNTVIGSFALADVLSTRQENSLGYAFTWLKGSLGAPLGEWP